MRFVRVRARQPSVRQGSVRDPPIDHGLRGAIKLATLRIRRDGPRCGEFLLRLRVRNQLHVDWRLLRELPFY